MHYEKRVHEFMRKKKNEKKTKQNKQKTEEKKQGKI